jgi:hypothetical protein
VQQDARRNVPRRSLWWLEIADRLARFGLIVQGWSVWKLRQSIKLARLAPFLIGDVIGVPIGGERRKPTSSSRPNGLRPAQVAASVGRPIRNSQIVSRLTVPVPPRNSGDLSSFRIFPHL